MGDQPRQKGIGLANARAWVVERFGQEGWQRVLEQLGAADRAELERVLPMRWYPQGHFVRLVRAIDEVHGVGDLATAVQLGRWSAERDLSTVYRMFFRFANPAFVIEKATDYWRRFHETGEWTVERLGDRQVVGTLRGWQQEDVLYCRVNGAYVARLLELVGARGVVVDHAQCTTRGDPACVYRVRWGDEIAHSGKMATARPHAPPEGEGAREAFSASVDALAAREKRRGR